MEAHGNNYPWPPPDRQEGEEVYTVKQILKDHQRGCGYQYYILWEGYLITEASWESESAFSTDGEMLAKYKDVKLKGRERRRLRSNCRETHQDRDSGMSQT